MLCCPRDLIRRVISLHCVDSASYLYQQDGRPRRQLQASLPVNLAKEAKPHTFKSQIAKVTKVISAYSVIRRHIRNEILFGKTVCFSCAHCLLG